MYKYIKDKHITFVFSEAQLSLFSIGITPINPQDGLVWIDLEFCLTFQTWTKCLQEINF